MNLCINPFKKSTHFKLQAKNKSRCTNPREDPFLVRKMNMSLSKKHPQCVQKWLCLSWGSNNDKTKKNVIKEFVSSGAPCSWAHGVPSAEWRWVLRRKGEPGRRPQSDGGSSEGRVNHVEYYYCMTVCSHTVNVSLRVPWPWAEVAWEGFGLGL